MTLAVLAAIAAALCYGVASVLQAVGARAAGASVAGVTRSLPYVIGVALDIGGFLVSIVALRQLPLFCVQAVVASSVVVTALIAIPVLKTRMRRPEALSVGAVCGGLVLLGLSSSGTVVHETPTWLPVAALGLGLILAVAARVGIRRNVGGPPLAVLAGLAFGLVGLSVRLLRSPGSPTDLLTDPAFYSLALAGVLALVLYAAALQQWQVTSATAVVVTLDTLVPAVVGFLFLGDRAAPGHGAWAALGFLAAVGGAVVLARLGAGLPGDEKPVSPPARTAGRTPPTKVGPPALAKGSG